MVEILGEQPWGSFGSLEETGGDGVTHRIARSEIGHRYGVSSPTRDSPQRGDGFPGFDPGRPATDSDWVFVGGGAKNVHGIYFNLVERQAGPVIFYQNHPLRGGIAR